MMLFTPAIIFWLLMAGGVVVVILSRRRVRFVDETATVITGLVLLAWFLLRPHLPLTTELSSWADRSPLPFLKWRVDEVAWRLSAWLLLLIVGGLLARLSARYVSGQREGAEPNAVNWPTTALVLWLAASGIAIFWADSLAGIMTGWMLLTLAWGTALLATSTKESEDLPRTFWGLGWLMLSLAFLWLAAAQLPVNHSQNLIMRNWPTVATSSVLTAALLQMGIWPWTGWRMLDRQLAPLLAASLHIIPALAGSSLLVHLVATSDISMGYSMFLTGFGLLGVLLALYRAWGHLHAVSYLETVLALAQTSLILLAGVWAGSEAMMAETGVLVLAVGVLFLAVREPVKRFGWGWTLAVGLAVAAAAGAPLTVGFLGRAVLYDAWLEEGRLLLLIVTSLLHLPLITVILIYCWPRRSQDRAGLPAEGDRLIMTVGLLLPAVGLLSFRQIAPGPLRLGAWLAVLLPGVASLVAFAYLGDLRELRKAVFAAFSFNLTFIESLRHGSRALIRQAGSVVREAATILEGEGGMLWLLVLVVVFLLAG